MSRTAPGAPIPMRTWEPDGALAPTRARAPRAGSVWGWRWPFVLVALPALAAAALMLGTTREPPRGCTEAALSVRRPCPGRQAAPSPRRPVALEHLLGDCRRHAEPCIRVNTPLYVALR